MNSEVSVETKELKASMRRNAIAKFVVSTIVVGVITYLAYSGSIAMLTGILCLAAFALVSEALNYWVSLSVLIDRAIFAIRKRATVK